MNREIKFRGKRVSDNKWIYGLLNQHQSKLRITTEKIEYPTHSDPAGGWFYTESEVDPETVGQYVGEVCGIHLWENDIIKITNLKETWRSEPQFDWRVLRIEYNRFVWSLKNYYLYMPLGEMDEDCTYTYEMILLGNIHDNPELL